MELAYKKTHKSRPSKKQLEEWFEKFPIMLDQWMETERKEIKKRIADPIKKKKAQERHKVSQLRNRTIIAQMGKLGYYGINEGSKMAKMKEGLENDEIIEDLIEEISDPYGGDHDMVDINYDEQFKRHIKEYENRYKNVYVVEDLPEKPKEIKIPSKKIEELIIIKEKPIQKPKKEVKRKEKLTSTIIVSNNPIKISPVKTLEMNEPKKPRKKPIKKPIKKAKKTIIAVIKTQPQKKKKVISKKKPIKKKSSLTVYYKIIKGKRVRLKRLKPKRKSKK